LNIRTMKFFIPIFLLFFSHLPSQAKQDTLKIGRVKDEVRVIVPFMYKSSDERKISNLVWGNGIYADETDESQIFNYLSLNNFRQWRITIRDNIQFNDGTIVTAEDIKFTIELYRWLMRNKGYFYHEILEYYDQFIIQTDLSFEISFSRSLGNLQTKLRDLPVIPSKIFKKESFEESYELLKKSIPVGRGHFHVLRWDSSSELLLERLPEHTASENEVKYIHYLFFDNEEDMITSFITGKLDYITLYDRHEATEVKNADRNNILVLTSKLISDRMIPYLFIVFNRKNSLFSTVEIREALSHAINHNRMLLEEQKAGFITRSLANSPIFHESWAYDENLEGHNYNPDRTKELLLNNNWRDRNGDDRLDLNGKDFSFKMIFPKRYRFINTIVSQIKLDFSEIGINMEPIPLDITQIEEKINSSDYEAALLMSNFYQDNIYKSLKEFFRYKGVIKRENIFDYLNTQLYNVIIQGRDEVDRDIIKRNYQLVQRQINNNRLCVFLFFQQGKFYLIHTGKFDNVINNQILPIERWKYSLGKEQD